MTRAFLFTLAFQLMTLFVYAQTKDTLTIESATSSKKNPALLRDSIPKSKHVPRKATIRSAILPGWGQAYNKKYWKIPIVYAAIGIPLGIFIYNKKWYNETSKAIQMLSADPLDTANYKQRIDEKLWIFYTDPSGSLPALVNYRNEFRRSMDYSILFVLIAWGLNVVDATVDAHLREFDVSDNLSFHIKPTIFSGSTVAGVSIVFTLGRHSSKTITSR